MAFNAVKFARRWLAFLPEGRRLELYPPWWMMRIKVLALENEWRHIRIRLPLTWASRNMGGSMFGGFQASLADPIAPLACSKVFPEFHVWTRHLSVDFVRPGISDMELRFDFPPEKEVEIREELARRGRSTPSFEYGLYDSQGRLCTKVVCVVAIRPPEYLKGVGSAAA
ncbi:PaaI family thioesterase [Thiothrix subterranea]|uniref:PaaI family thioesterase n=1 Tax=Thiothrix subterranea TaxID=2735563 RepID=UPI00192B86D9|nr:PaaI family thioesterase [Thiothrix subterranea]QQZ28607.1 PaaI family thioesterase [Thiothrix subterranea]